MSEDTVKEFPTKWLVELQLEIQGEYTQGIFARALGFTKKEAMSSALIANVCTYPPQYTSSEHDGATDGDYLVYTVVKATPVSNEQWDMLRELNIG